MKFRLINYPFNIVGVPDEPIQRVYLNNISVEMAGEESQIQHTKDILFNNISIEGESVYVNKQ